MFSNHRFRKESGLQTVWGNRGKGLKVLARTLTITVNNSQTEVTEGTTIEMLIEQFGVADPGLVVEQNGRLVFPQNYAATIVSANDRVAFVNCGFSG